MAVDTLTMTVLVLIYLAATLIIGYLGYRQTKSSEDYLVAGRCSHPVVIALSYGATFISTSAIIGFGGAGGKPWHGTHLAYGTEHRCRHPPCLLSSSERRPVRSGTASLR